jgi:hypothetical protein
MPQDTTFGQGIVYPSGGQTYDETGWMSQYPGWGQPQGQGTYGDQSGGGSWNYNWSDPGQGVTFGGYNAISPQSNWNAPNFNFSDPSIWGSTQQQIQNMYSQGGMPTNVTPAWQAAQQVANNALRETLANANEQYSAGRQRFSTGAGSAFSQAGADAGAQLAAQRLAMELQAQEAARGRQMQAMGLGNELGGQQMNYQLGQANYGLGRSGLELQNQQNEWNNQMGMLNAMMGFGNQMQGYGQNALDRMYADWGAENSMPYLNAALQYAGQYPPGAVVQQQSALGGILGGLGSLIPGIGALGSLFGSGGGSSTGSSQAVAGTPYTGPSYSGFTFSQPGYTGGYNSTVYNPGYTFGSYGG